MDNNGKSSEELAAELCKFINDNKEELTKPVPLPNPKKVSGGYKFFGFLCALSEMHMESKMYKKLHKK